MLYIFTKRLDGKLIAAQVNPERDGTPQECRGVYPAGFCNEENRNNWKTFAAAKEVAAVLGKEYLATDAGPNVSPRYDVIRMWKVGDKVSQSFNGDSYPCGLIVKISKTLKCITTDGGLVFYRVRQTGSWRNEGTWFLSPGHVDKRNPSF